jgi:hypothetical protein
MSGLLFLRNRDQEDRGRNYIAHRLPSAKTCHSPFSPFYLGNFSPLNDLNTLYRGWMGCVRGSTYLEESDSKALAGDRFSNVLALGWNDF